MKHTRRTVLRTASALTATALGTGTVIAARPAPIEERDDDQRRSKAVTDTRIQTTDRTCGSEDWSNATIEGDTIRIVGQIAASHPCHEAVFVAIKQCGETLYVTIGLEPMDGICIMCLGTIGYEATIELNDSSSVSDVIVTHRGMSTNDEIAPPK